MHFCQLFGSVYSPFSPRPPDFHPLIQSPRCLLSPRPSHPWFKHTFCFFNNYLRFCGWILFWFLQTFVVLSFSMLSSSFPHLTSGRCIDDWNLVWRDISVCNPDWGGMISQDVTALQVHHSKYQTKFPWDVSHIINNFRQLKDHFIGSFANCSNLWLIIWERLPAQSFLSRVPSCWNS